MKKLIFSLIVSGLLLSLYPVQSNAASIDPPSSVIIVNTESSAEVKTLLLRLDEINSMDKSDLKSPEKKDLRKEVRSIKQQLKETNGGVYLSGGAIIIILIVLLVLF
jgi:hypothetical protein